MFHCTSFPSAVIMEDFSFSLQTCALSTAVFLFSCFLYLVFCHFLSLLIFCLLPFLTFCLSLSVSPFCSFSSAHRLRSFSQSLAFLLLGTISVCVSNFLLFLSFFSPSIICLNFGVLLCTIAITSSLFFF